METVYRFPDSNRKILRIYRQQKQFDDAQTQTESFHRQNKNVFNAQTQTLTSTSYFDLQDNLRRAMFRRDNRLKRLQSQTLCHSAKLRAKWLERYADLRDGLTWEKWSYEFGTGVRCFRDDVMTFADNENISIEMLLIKFLEKAHSRKSKKGKTGIQKN